MDIRTRLFELAISLPIPPAPVASYVPWVRTGPLVFISGQLPLQNGLLACKGLVGETVTVEEAAAGARLCATNLLAQLAMACQGDLNRVVRCIRLGGFVAALATFTEHSKVMNGASDLLLAVMDEAGRHARSTIGVASLPLGAAVEVEGLFEVT